MSLADRYAKRPTDASPTDFTCPHYQPVPDGKRCAHYLDNGACDREDEFMCVEWLRLNHPDNPLVKTDEKSPRTDLLGVPIPEEAPLKTEPEMAPCC